MENGPGPDQKIKITALLKDASVLYLRNLKPLLFLSVISALVAVGQELCQFYCGDISTLAAILIAIIRMLATIWIDIALIYAVASIHSRNVAVSAHIDNSAAFAHGDHDDSSFSRLPFFKLLIKPWSRFWKCLWTSIGFTMGMITPILIIGFLPRGSGASPVFVAILYAFASIYVFQFHTRYLFAITSAALESKVTDAYANSEGLVRGHFWKVFAAVLIIIAVSSLISIVGLLSGTLSRIPFIAIRLGLNSLHTQQVVIGYGMLVKPLITSFTVLLYLRLKEAKEQILKASRRPVRRISNL